MSVNICDANGNLTRVDGMAFGGWTLLKEGTTGTSYPLDIANLISNYSEVCVAVPIDSDNETYWDSFIIPTALMSPSSLKSFYGSRYFDSSNFEMINLQTYFSNGNNIRVAFFAQGTAVTRSWKLYARNGGDPAGSGSGSVSVTGDGVKTYAQILQDLYDLCDKTKITAKSYIERYALNLRFIFPLDYYASNILQFQRMIYSNSTIQAEVLYLRGANSTFLYFDGSSHTDRKNEICPVGNTITLYY